MKVLCAVLLVIQVVGLYSLPTDIAEERSDLAFSTRPNQYKNWFDAHQNSKFTFKCKSKGSCNVVFATIPKYVHPHVEIILGQRSTIIMENNEAIKVIEKPNSINENAFTSFTIKWNNDRIILHNEIGVIVVEWNYRMSFPVNYIGFSSWTHSADFEVSGLKRA